MNKVIKRAGVFIIIIVLLAIVALIYKSFENKKIENQVRGAIQRNENTNMSYSEIVDLLLEMNLINEDKVDLANTAADTFDGGADDQQVE